MESYEYPYAEPEKIYRLIKSGEMTEEQFVAYVAACADYNENIGYEMGKQSEEGNNQ